MDLGRPVDNLESDRSLSATFSFTNPLLEGLITDWSWSQEFAIYTFAHCKSSSWLAWHVNQNRPPDSSRLPLWRLGARLKHFPLQIVKEKRHLEAAAGLKHFPLLIL